MSDEATIHVDVYGRTDIGRVRDANQDCFLVGDLDQRELCDLDLTGPVGLDAQPRGPMLVVCDGMGGSVGGDVASQLAARVLWAEMREAQATEERVVYARILRRAVRVANRRVFEESQRNPELAGMGTTLSAAGLVGDGLLLAQIGDSRAYIHRGRTLTQVTRDQSIVSALLHAGRITEKEAKTSAQSNMILQALGVREDVEVSLSIVELRRGDRLLLCSDGLHGPVAHNLMTGALTDHADVREAIDSLVMMARAAGGPDNITAVLAEFTGDRLRPPMSEDDLPRFTELDPHEEALTTTSWVARRLAAKAGIGDEEVRGPVVPATGQHSTLSPTGKGPSVRRVEAEPVGPATEAFARAGRLGLLPWLIAGALALALVAVLLWGGF